MWTETSEDDDGIREFQLAIDTWERYENPSVYLKISETHKGWNV